MILKKVRSKFARLPTRALALMLSLTIVSCQTGSPSSGKINFDDVLADAEKNAANQVLVSEEEALADIMPSVNIDLVPLPEPRFDVKVQNVDIKFFFMGLIQSTPYNLVVSPGVKGKISLDLRGVTVPQVMALVRDVYGYDYKFNQGVYTVLPIGLRTELFTLDYINLERSGSSRTIVNSGQVQGSGNSGGGISAGQTSQGSTSGSSSTQQSTSTQIETSTNAKVWDELEQTLSILVADSKNAQVKVSPQVGVIVVRAEPQALRLVRHYLNISANNLSRQVILEAKILEVILNKGHQSGVDWQSFGAINGGNILNLSQTGQSVGSTSANNPLQGLFSLVFQRPDFNAVIQLLNTQGDVQVLSSPKISTLNNQKAVLKSGSDEFFVTDVSTTTIAGSATSTVTPDVTLTPFFSGIALDVTPQISANGDIILHVHPTVSEVVDQTKVIDLGDSNFTLPLALSTVREADTIVRAKSGQVIVIGGLMQEKTQFNESSTPLLGSIPLLGNLFRQTDENRVKSELIILLRAQVVEDGTWQKEISNFRARMQPDQ